MLQPMRARRVFAILLTLAVGSCAVQTPEAPLATREAFIEHYGLSPMSREERTDTEDATAPSIEGAVRFDEETTHSEYRYTPSIVAIRELFRERSMRRPPAPRSARDVRRAIDESFGVSKLGTGLQVVGVASMSENAYGRLHDLHFRFGDGGFGQAIVGVPDRSNGVLLIALHGCRGSPDMVMTDQESYANAFGLRAVERGYTVAAPYILGECAWIHNLDWLATLSGASVFGYELAKIGELARWARSEYGARRTVIWGISLGGQYAMLSSAFYGELFDVTVISGAAGDYEKSYRDVFDAAGLDANNRIGVNTQAVLSGRFWRPDVVASILPRSIVFEISTGDLGPEAIEFVTYLDQAAQRARASRPNVVLFEGVHETNPEATLEVIDDLTR
jgi:hypothetical protein